jgi:hypothetical protein
MQLRRLGKSDLKISPILMGTWQAGKDMWVGIDDAQTTRPWTGSGPWQKKGKSAWGNWPWPGSFPMPVPARLPAPAVRIRPYKTPELQPYHYPMKNWPV